MTNDQLLEDLKQFITATVSQQTAGLSTKEDLAGLATKQDIDSLKSEMNERFDEVMDAERDSQRSRTPRYTARA